jgi:hypothetical protein
MSKNKGSSPKAARTAHRKLKPIYLVACVGKKLPHSALAKDLYRSEWFLRARGYVEAKHGRWFILSARYGLIASNKKVAPYELTLNTMDIEVRRKWARRVIAQMKTQLPPSRQIIVLAGKRYRDFLMDYLESRATVSVPLKGLGIGRQLKALGPAPRSTT